MLEIGDGGQQVRSARSEGAASRVLSATFGSTVAASVVRPLVAIAESRANVGSADRVISGWSRRIAHGLPALLVAAAALTLAQRFPCDARQGRLVRNSRTSSTPATARQRGGIITGEAVGAARQ